MLFIKIKVFLTKLTPLQVYLVSLFRDMYILNLFCIWMGVFRTNYYQVCVLKLIHS